jgi:AAA15 family ATPase/GTPase
MEACYICLQQTQETLLQTFIIRNKRNYIYYDRHIELDGAIKPLKNLFEQKFEICVNKKEKFSYMFKKNISNSNYIHRQNIDDIFKNIKLNIQFLDGGVTDKELEFMYGILQEQNKEYLLVQYINMLDSTIKNFKFIHSTPKLQIKDKYLHLSNFGDGLKSYISIICALNTCKNGVLFLDELENGIHYTKLDQLWELILSISKEQNVQVFATTHSKEMIESYARVAKKLEDDDTYYFEMYKNIKKENIEMRALDINQLEYELTHQGGFRGE